MKKIIVCLLLSSIAGGVKAQLRDMMMKKVGEKVVKNKSEKNTSTEAPADTAKTQPSNTNQSPGYNPFMSGGKKEILPEYVFQQNVLMETKSWDKKGKLEEKKNTWMRWYFSTQPYNAMEILDENKKPTAFSIFESKKAQSVMLMDSDGNKMAVVSKMDTAQIRSDVAKSNENSGAKVVKTGRTKKVCGYNCEEWVSTDDKGNKTEMWVSAEVPITMGGSFTMFGSQNKEMSGKFNSTNYPAGYMMEMTSYQTNGEKFMMTAIEVNLKADKVVSTAGYVVY